MRHQQRVEFFEFSRRNWREEFDIPVRLYIKARAVKQHQSADSFRVFRGDKLYDPAAHRPSAQIHLLQSERIEESGDDGRFVLDRIGEILGLITLAITGQVGQINAEAGLCQVGRQPFPIFRAPSQAMHENDHRTVGGSKCVVVNAMFTDIDETAPGTDQIHLRLIEDAKNTQRTQPERGPQSNDENEKNESEPFGCTLQPCSCSTSERAFARCHPVSITRTVIGSSANALWLFHSARSTQRTASASDAACKEPPTTRQR